MESAHKRYHTTESCHTIVSSFSFVIYNEKNFRIIMLGFRKLEIYFQYLYTVHNV